MKVFLGHKRSSPANNGSEFDHTCEFPRCNELGPYRAPKTPVNIRSYRWFCLKHVRDYNKAWNFFEGWTRKDIEHFQRDDITGHRPTWPVYGKRHLQEEMDNIENVFHNFSSEWFAHSPKRSSTKKGSKPPQSSNNMNLKEACLKLNLEKGFTRTTLRRNYMRLVKKYHPDLNGGSKESEELLKSINQAYTYLQTHLFCHEQR